MDCHLAWLYTIQEKTKNIDSPCSSNDGCSRNSAGICHAKGSGADGTGSSSAKESHLAATDDGEDAPMGFTPLLRMKCTAFFIWKTMEEEREAATEPVTMTGRKAKPHFLHLFGTTGMTSLTSFAPGKPPVSALVNLLQRSARAKGNTVMMSLT